MTKVIGRRPRPWHTRSMSKPIHVAQVIVDVRGLEPPHPMLRILELLDRLAPKQHLLVIHERRPLLLYPQLEERGFRHETEELGPGEFRITIWREGWGQA